MRSLARPPDRHEMLGRLRTVGPDRVARWGRMSAHQMVCHLSDGFRMMIGLKPASPASGLLHRTVLRWLVLYAPVPWPRGIRTSPEIDQELQGTRPTDFATDVARLEQLVELVTTRDRGIALQPHPIFGRMSEAAWLRWGYLHTDHHLRQFGV